MKIIVAEGAGFCFGVERAINIAYKVLHKKENIYFLREIIHNPQEVEKLKQKGAIFVNNINNVPDKSTVIISAHGINPEEQKMLKEKKCNIIDTTCPFVKKIHNISEELVKNKYQVIIVGDKFHLEVQGILGYTKNKGVVIEKISDLDTINLEPKVGIVSQTTQSIENFKRIVDKITKKVLKIQNSEIRIFNTICNATQSRQEKTIELTKKVDIMIIIGGRNSANTRRLYTLSKKILKDVYHIETCKEIKKEWFKNKKVVGISAGASTPKRLIKQVIKFIKEIE